VCLKKCVFCVYVSTYVFELKREIEKARVSSIESMQENKSVCVCACVYM
jgi:hypothetical protein